MRREQNAVGGFALEGEQRVVSIGRLDRVDVHRRAAKAAGTEVGGQRDLVDDSAARRLYQHRAGLAQAATQTDPTAFTRLAREQLRGKTLAGE